MKKALLYIFIIIPLILGFIFWILLMGYSYYKVASTLQKNTDLEKAHTPEAKYNAYLQTGNNLYTAASLSGATFEVKIPLLEESVKSYSDALNLFSNEYAAKNLEYVQEQLRITKLEQEKEKQEQEKKKEEEQQGEENGDSQESEKSEEQTGEEDSQSDESKEGEGNSGDNGEGEQSNEEGTTGKGDEEGEQSDSEVSSQEQEGLSTETRDALEKEMKKLQEQQGDIGKFYNKVYKENKTRSPFDNFADIFGKSQFDNSQLEEQEKDW